MKRQLKLGIVGLGNMGSAFAFALEHETNWQVYIYDQDRQKLLKSKEFKTCANIKTIFDTVSVILLAIKPQDIKIFLGKNKEALLKNKPLLISIAAGVSTKFFEKEIENIRVIRAMPNLAAKICCAISCLCKGQNATANDLKIAEKVFSFVGQVLVVKEPVIDKITSVSGSGPGYIYYFMDAMYKSARKLGFKSAEAKMLVLYTFLGAVGVAYSYNDDFSQLVKNVASAKGTTQAALTVFKNKNLSKIVQEGIFAAYKRAKELGQFYG